MKKQIQRSAHAVVLSIQLYREIAASAFSVPRLLLTVLREKTADSPSMIRPMAQPAQVRA